MNQNGNQENILQSNKYGACSFSSSVHCDGQMHFILPFPLWQYILSQVEGTVQFQKHVGSDMK